MRKEISLSELGKLMAEGPAGQEKIKKQQVAITNLQEALMLMVKRRRPYEVPIKGTDNIIKFGVIGDTQIGSLYQRTDALTAFYERCEDEGVKYILHAGDVLDGWRVYRGQEFELDPNAKSWPEQRQMFVDLMPRTKDITTIFITGNHDSSFKKLVGMIVGEELALVRADWKFIGQDIGEQVFKTDSGLKFTTQLLHPGGGTAYAVSYQPQKIIESIAGGQKPDLIIIGHYHKSFYMPAYRNVTAILPGTFQSQTPFMIQHSLAAHIGGWIVTVTLNERKKLTSRIQAEWIGFFEEQR